MHLRYIIGPETFIPVARPVFDVDAKVSAVETFTEGSVEDVEGRRTPEEAAAYAVELLRTHETVVVCDTGSGQTTTFATVSREAGETDEQVEGQIVEALTRMLHLAVQDPPQDAA